MGAREPDKASVHVGSQEARREMGNGVIQNVTIIVQQALVHGTCDTAAWTELGQ